MIQCCLLAIFRDLFIMEASEDPARIVLKGGKHVMLSYNWNSQDIVSQIYKILKDEHIPIWFDIQGDMKQNIYDRYDK